MIRVAREEENHTVDALINELQKIISSIEGAE